MPLGSTPREPPINAQGYIGHLIHILEVEWVIADCIMDLIKHFSLFVCGDSVPLVIKCFENVFFQKRIVYSVLRAFIYLYI